jgi:hypothetical protein
MQPFTDLTTSLYEDLKNGVKNKIKLQIENRRAEEIKKRPKSYIK